MQLVDADREGSALSSHGAVASEHSTGVSRTLRFAQATAAPNGPAQPLTPGGPAPNTPAEASAHVIAVKPTPLGNGVGASAYRLPPDVSFDTIRLVGHDLVLVQRDGSTIVLERAEADGGGAKPVPTLFIGDVEIPREALAAAFEANGIVPAAGPAGGAPASSGGDFSVTPGDIGDPFGISPLLPPTDLSFAPLNQRTIAPFLTNAVEEAAGALPPPIDLWGPRVSPPARCGEAGRHRRDRDRPGEPR